MIPRFIATGALFLGLAGCGGPSGPKIVNVHGTVLLNGEPLSEALVEFVPETGRPSSAITDDAGRYELMYAHEQKGVQVGTHQVKIKTGREEATVEGKVVQEAVPETIPERYNAKSELTADVESDNSEIDFELESN